MHIADGILPPATLAAGAALGAVGVGIGLWRLDAERVPHAAVMASALFVASLVHVPIGPSSAHLVLSALAGLVLGWAVFPATLVALLLQLLLFGHGGVTTLGVNTVTLATPGLLCWLALGRLLARRPSPRWAVLLGGLGGASAIAIGCAIWATALATAGEAFADLVVVLVAAHVAIMVVEGLVTGAATGLLARVRPEVFQLGHSAGESEPGGPLREDD